MAELNIRAHQLRMLIDSYKLKKGQRANLIDRIIEVSIYETAQQAIDINVDENTVGNMWGISWRARSTKWIIENREVLEPVTLFV